jgi:hypothetical protein
MPGESKNREVNELSSPACSMREADDVYLGYAGKDEIATLVGELLAAERSMVSKLREMLPRVRDDGLYGKLGEMMRTHERNIAFLDALVR